MPPASGSSDPSPRLGHIAVCKHFHVRPNARTREVISRGFCYLYPGWDRRNNIVELGGDTPAPTC